MKRIILLVFFMLFLAGKQSTGQEAQMRIVTHPEEVHIYHTKKLPAGYGFNIYRQDSRGAEYRLINDFPVTRARSSGELQSRLGGSYSGVVDFFEAGSAGDLWMLLQSRFLESMIAVSLFPELAKSLGMLYVDNTAPIGKEVTYRLEFINISGDVWDKPLSATVQLEPGIPDAPSQLKAENDGAAVSLQWHYPRVEPKDDDKVIRFFIYRINPGNGRPELLNDDILIRNNAYEEHFYHFRSPVVNQTEQYFVTAADITGQQSMPGEVLSHEIIDITPPGIVRDVRVGLSAGNYTGITWTRPVEPDIEGYHIYRTTDLSLPFEKITTEPLPAGEQGYVDMEVEAGRTYFYHVTAVNKSGFESEKGNLVMLQIKDVAPPPPPENLTGKFDIPSGSVFIDWETEETTDQLKSFIILRRREDGRKPGGFSRTHPGDLRELSFIDTGEGGRGFHEGGRYRYVVYSSDHTGNYSDTASIVIEVPLFTPPGPPAGLTAANDRGIRINLTWNASPSGTVDEYIIYRGDTDSQPLTELARVPSTARSYRDEEAGIANEYVYVLTAVDRAGNESEFSAADTLLFNTPTPLRSVRNVQATERDGGIYMRWEKVPGNGLAGYRVTRSDIPTGIYEPVHKGLLAETEFFDPEGESDQWYRVCAVDSSGNESRPARAIRPVSSGEN